jgi:hypothetical protein
MKINITIDCTPEEAKKLCNLPNLDNINNIFSEKVEEIIRENIDKMKPENIYKNVFSKENPFLDLFKNLNPK